MSWESIQGALVTVSMFFGVPVLYTGSLRQTVQTFLYAARQSRAVTTDTLARHSRRPKRKAALQSYILQGLPGVGPKRARELLAKLGTVSNVINAAPELLCEIQGISTSTAVKMRSALE